MNIERTFLSADYYKRLLDKTDIVTNIHSVLQESIKEDMIDEMHSEDSADNELMRDHISIVIDALAKAFDVKWLNSNIDIAIDEVLRFIKGEIEELELVIYLGDKKEIFRRELVVSMEKLFYENPEAIDISKDMIGDMADKIIEDIDIPDQLIFADIIGNDIFSEEIKRTIEQINKTRHYFSFVPYIIFAFFLTLFCLLAKVPGGMKWFGSGLLISGIISLIGLQMIRFASPLMIKNIGDEFPADAATVITDLIRYTVARLSFVPLLYASAGLVFIIVGIIIINKIGSGPQTQE